MYYSLVRKYGKKTALEIIAQKANKLFSIIGFPNRTSAAELNSDFESDSDSETETNDSSDEEPEDNKHDKEQSEQQKKSSKIKI